MNATQVLFRFLKEEGLYTSFFKCGNMVARAKRVPKNVYSLREHDIERNAVDIVLKSERCSLFYVLSFIPLEVPYWELQKKFHAFLKNNINGNYLKVFIPDYSEEETRYYDRKFRNGYHYLEFSLKDESKREI